jgi:hypothetical protein
VYLPLAGKAADANLLDGRDSSAFARSAYSTNVAISEGLAGEDIAQLQVQINAPTSGYLIVGASIDRARSGAGPEYLTCFVAVDGFIVPGSARTLQEWDWWNVSCPGDAAIPVAPGQHNVLFQTTGDCGLTSYSGQGTLWALWVPFDGNGAVVTGSLPTGKMTVEEGLATLRQGPSRC